MSILPVFVNITDYFLTERQRASAELTMRTRMIVCYFIFQSSYNFFGIISFLNFVGLEEILLSSSFLAVALFCLFLIRKGFSSEKIAASYLAVVVTFIGAALLQVGASSPADFYLASGLIVNLVIALLILPSGILRRMMLLLFFLVNGTFLWHLASDFAGKTLSFRSVLILPPTLINSIFLLVLVAMILRVRAIAQKDIDKEIEWQERNLRLGELTSMIRTFQLLFDRPIRAFQTGLKNLQYDHKKRATKRMQGDVDELILLSQSFNWIYRAYHREEFSAVLSTTLLRQLQALLSSKIEKEGWTLDTIHSGSPVEVQGPIPSLVLFLFTIITQIVEGPQPEGKRQISIEAGNEEQFLFWKISWPSGISVGNEKGPRNPDSNLLTHTLRQELIHELVKICKADMREYQEQDFCHLLIRTPWKRPEVGSEALFD